MKTKRQLIQDEYHNKLVSLRAEYEKNRDLLWAESGKKRTAIKTELKNKLKEYDEKNHI